MKKLLEIYLETLILLKLLKEPDRSKWIDIGVWHDATKPKEVTYLT